MSANNERTIDIQEGHNLVYTWHQKQYPESDVYWTKNDNDIVLHSEVLNLTDTGKEDTGYYFYKAYNDTTQSNVTLVVVHVNVLCKLSFESIFVFSICLHVCLNVVFYVINVVKSIFISVFTIK